MRSLLRRATAISSPPPATTLLSTFFQGACRSSKEKLSSFRGKLEDPGVSYGLTWALAGRGVVVKDKLFYNLETSELQKGSTTKAENLSGIPLHVRGNVVGSAPDISKAQFGKLLKLVSYHLSSVSSVYVQDGAIGPSSECDAKVRVISDNSSAVVSLSKVLWGIPSRAISHDTCPLTVYVASSISTNVREVLGAASQSANGFAAADIERSSLILCGKAFADSYTIKDALAALAAPILSARGGLVIPGRLLSSGDSVILLLAPDEIVKGCPEIQKALVSIDIGIAISPHGSSLLFPTSAASPNVLEKPASLILVSSDSTGALPAISKVSPGQAAYHFLAGYQDGVFVPVYNKGPFPIDPLALAVSLLSQLKEDNTPSFLINAKHSGKYISGKDFMKLVESASCHNLPDHKLDRAKVRELKGKYKRFLSGKYQDLPEEFSF